MSLRCILLKATLPETSRDWVITSGSTIDSIFYSNKYPGWSVKKPRQRVTLVSGVQQAPIRALIDDLTMTARSVLEGGVS